MSNIIEGKYSFEITKEIDKNYGKVFYIAKIKDMDGYEFTTYGDTPEEIFQMIADCYLCVKDIPVGKWSRFWHSILNLY